MAIKNACYDDKIGIMKGCDVQIGTRIICKWSLIPLILMTLLEIMVDSVRKWEESFERDAVNVEKYSGARIPDAPESLEGNDVGMNLAQMMHLGLIRPVCVNFTPKSMVQLI